MQTLPLKVTMWHISVKVSTIATMCASIM